MWGCVWGYLRVCVCVCVNPKAMQTLLFRLRRTKEAAEPGPVVWEISLLTVAYSTTKPQHSRTHQPLETLALSLLPRTVCPGWRPIFKKPLKLPVITILPPWSHRGCLCVPLGKVSNKLTNDSKMRIKMLRCKGMKYTLVISPQHKNVQKKNFKGGGGGSASDYTVKRCLSESVFFPHYSTHSYRENYPGTILQAELLRKI